MLGKINPCKELPVSLAEMIELPCPNCQEGLYRPLAWFRARYNTCPRCGGGISVDQLAPLLDAIEAEFDARIDELLQEKTCGGCCGRQQEPPSPREVGRDA